MDKTFEKFLRRNIDLGPLGAERRRENSGYFCTPRGASIFGWAGVDGIHFCFVRGFGGMVFAVSPMNIAPNYVRPIARSFEDFLRLLLSTGDTAALEQAWMWDEAQFDAFLRENPPTEEQRRVMDEIARKLGLAPMERPWAYIKELQSAFDCSKIKYTEDFYDEDMNPGLEPQPPEWRVYFDAGFWSRSDRGRAGKEVSLDKEFTWAGHFWIVPAMYVCAKGLVVDFCMRSEPEDIRRFAEKWHLSPENDSFVNFTREQRTEMERENPLELQFHPSLTVNGKPALPSGGSGLSFNPCFPENCNNPEAIWTVEHYGLDDTRGWAVTRYAFPWPVKRRPELRTLSLTMEAQPVELPGPRFKPREGGDTFVFKHPVSGAEYTLTVLELERQTLPAGAFRSKDWIFPTNAVAMTYALTPEPREPVSIRDCSDGDRPMRLEPDPGGPTAFADAVIIGYSARAGGDNTVTLPSGETARKRVDFSSLHFEPVESDVEWRAEFTVTPFEKAEFSLYSA